jgi:hypothetical protein
MRPLSDVVGWHPLEAIDIFGCGAMVCSVSNVRAEMAA